MSLYLKTSAIISFLLLLAYVAHFWMTYSRHSQIMTNDDAIRQRIDQLPKGDVWLFLLITIGLPLFFSLYSSWVTNPMEVVDEQSLVDLLPAPFFTFAISIFVLMITIEVSFLYNKASTNWQAFIIGALVIDIIALLVFLGLIKPPEKIVPESSILLIVFFVAVGIGSLLSSCATIYLAKIHSEN